MDTPEAGEQPIVVKRKKRRRRLKETDSVFDHVWPWAVASIVIVLVFALSIATAMTESFVVAVFGAAFLSLCGLLTLRLALCRLWKRAPDLRIRSKWQLKGALAMVLPPVILLMLIFAREMGVVDMGLNRGMWSSSYTYNTASQTPASFKFDEAPTLRLPRGQGDFVSAFNEALAPLATRVIGGTIEIECDPPKSYLPLFKSATTTYVVNARLRTRRSTIQLKFKGTATGVVTGFAPSRVIPAGVGSRIGASVRDSILSQLR